MMSQSTMVIDKEALAPSVSQSSRLMGSAEKATYAERSDQKLSTRDLSMSRSIRAPGRPCDLCSKKHHKCEGGIPCRLCVKQGVECKFDRPDRRPSPTSRIDGVATNGQDCNNGGSRDSIQSLPMTYFTQSQLSLALSIQRSKPTNITTKDYFQQLRKHIQIYNAEAKGEHRYIDAVEFWKEQFTKLHSEKRHLEVKVAQMELLINPSSNLALVLSEIEIPETPSVRIASRKRKAAAIEDVDLDEPIAQIDTNTWAEADTANCLPLLKSAQALYRLTGDNQVPVDTLLKAILSSISSSEAIAREVCETVSEDKPYWTEFASQEAIRSFQIIAAVFNICLKGLAHLCRDIGGRRCKGQVVYALVHLFVDVLGFLHNLCVLQATLKPRDGYSSVLNTKSQKCARISNMTAELSRLLATFLSSPEFQTPNSYYFEVLEGLFSSLLTRVGSLMSQAIFKKDLTLSKRPGRIASPEYDPLNLSMNEVTVQLEGEALAMVLKRAIAGKDEGGPVTLARILTRTNASNRNSRSEILLTKARTSLQKTLMKGAFGEDGDEFRDALKIPKRSGEVNFTETQHIGQGRSRTFIETVYSIVGWETLLST